MTNPYLNPSPLPVDEFIRRTEKVAPSKVGDNLSWVAEDYDERDRRWARRAFVRAYVKQWFGHPPAKR